MGKHGVPVKKQKIELFILTDLIENEPSARVDKKDISTVRDLAKKVYEISKQPKNIEKIKLIKDHNSLIKTRPVVLCFPENGYEEIIPLKSLETKDPFLRAYEYYLRCLLYHGEELDDDYPLTIELKVPMVFEISGRGIEEHWTNSQNPNGAAKVEQVIKDEADIKKLKFPKLTVDKDATNRNLIYLTSIFGEILDVKLYKTIIPMYFDTMGMMGYLARARGMDQVFIDMIERPKWIHHAMDRICNGMLELIKDAEKRDLLGLNNSDNYVGTGGLGYTHDLPQEDFDGKVRLKDLWGLRESQEMTGISPAMFDEFVLPYEIKYFENFGLNYYACCEDLSRKFKIIKKIPRLRRISVAPWTNMKIAAQELEDKYVYVWKPNPAVLAMESFDEDLIRKIIMDGFEVGKNCIMDIIMKDTHTFRNKPERLKKWCKIAKELSYKYE